MSLGGSATRPQHRWAATPPFAGQSPAPTAPFPLSQPDALEGVGVGGVREGAVEQAAPAGDDRGVGVADLGEQSAELLAGLVVGGVDDGEPELQGADLQVQVAILPGLGQGELGQGDELFARVAEALAHPGELHGELGHEQRGLLPGEHQRLVQVVLGAAEFPQRDAGVHVPQRGAAVGVAAGEFDQLLLGLLHLGEALAVAGHGALPTEHAAGGHLPQVQVLAAGDLIGPSGPDRDNTERTRIYSDLCQTPMPELA